MPASKEGADIEAVLKSAREKMAALDTAGARDVLTPEIAEEARRFELLLNEQVTVERLAFDYDAPKETVAKVTRLAPWAFRGPGLNVSTLTQGAQAIIAILGFLALVLWLYKTELEAPKRIDPHLSFLHAAQAFLIYVLLLVQQRELKGFLKKKLNDTWRIARRTFEQFESNWICMWRAWLALYIWLTIRYRLPASGTVSDALDAVTDFLNITSGFAIWACFLVLQYPSVNTEREPTRAGPYDKARRIALGIGILCVCLGPANRFFVPWHLGRVAVGLYTGLAVASLGGVLANRYINMPRWHLLSLYAYAMIQLCYSFFDIVEPAVIWVVFSAVLVGKWILFSIALNLLAFGGLESYLRAADLGLVLLPATDPSDRRTPRSDQS